MLLIFQSTPPARGATLLVSCSPHGSCDFNPRPPRGGRPFILRLIICTSSISIHAPREGGDAAEKIMQQSNGISIHAPREGGDKFGKLSRIIVEYFNPRPPRGGRRLMFRPLAVLMWISIHAPREGGDISTFFQRSSDPYFNPRPPRGGRPSFLIGRSCASDFNPRPPRGGRPLGYHWGDDSCLFQSTPPARGAWIL